METRKVQLRTPAEIWGLADPDQQRKARQDAIDDGDLIEITRMGRDAGITYPIAVSARAAERMVPFPNIPQETVTENLWDTLHAFRAKAFATTKEEFEFQVSLYQNGLVPNLTFKAAVSPGDDGEPSSPSCCRTRTGRRSDAAAVIARATGCSPSTTSPRPLTSLPAGSGSSSGRSGSRRSSVGGPGGSSVQNLNGS